MAYISKIAVVFMLVFCGCVRAMDTPLQTSRSVQWAGVSMAGDFAKAAALMPTLHELMTQDTGFSQRFEARVAQAVGQAAGTPSGLNIVVDGQLRQGDDAYALTFVLAGESVTSYAIEQTTFVDSSAKLAF